MDRFPFGCCLAVSPEGERRDSSRSLRGAIRSRIEPLKRFARNLKARIDSVLVHCRWPLSTTVPEGINNKVKVIKRMAYGYRDQDDFLLKIQQAFPGIP